MIYVCDVQKKARGPGRDKIVIGRNPWHLSARWGGKGGIVVFIA